MLLSRHAPLRSSIRSAIIPALGVAGPSTYFVRPTLAPDRRRRLTVLALESSADDSCAAIVNSDRQILSNVVNKQHGINVKHGGIHPLEAQHAHERNVVSRISASGDVNRELKRLVAESYH